MHYMQSVLMFSLVFFFCRKIVNWMVIVYSFCSALVHFWIQYLCICAEISAYEYNRKENFFIKGHYYIVYLK